MTPETPPPPPPPIEEQPPPPFTEAELTLPPEFFHINVDITEEEWLKILG